MSRTYLVGLVVLGWFAVYAAPAVSAPAVSYSKTIGYSGPAGLYAYGMDYDATDDTVLVSDYWNFQVKRFSADGQFIGVVSKRAPKDQPGGICQAYDVEADPDGNVWVADQACSRVVEFDHNGNWVRTIGRGGSPDYNFGCGEGRMQIPTHVLVDPVTRNVYVSDPRCANVYVFDPSGVFLFEFDWSAWDIETGLTKRAPRGLDQDANGTIYVVEHYSRAIAKFDRSGNYLGKLPRQWDMNDPRGLAIDKVNKLIYVVGAHTEQVFEWSITTGKLVRKWGSSGGIAFDSIRFPAADDAGNVWIGDTWGYRVWKFNKLGNPLPWSTPPAPPPNGGYNYNDGVAVSSTGKLFVVDAYEQRVQRFDASKSCTWKTSCPAFETAFGQRAPAGQEGLGYPHTVAYGADSVWVGDNNNRVTRWTPDGTYVSSFGSIGLIPGKFQGGVQGLDIANDSVYATSPVNCRLQIFGFDGTLLNHMGGCGTGPNLMKAPRGLDAAGNTVYVAEAGGNRISVWDTTTKTAQVLTPVCDGKSLLGPMDVALDALGQWLYISDAGNKRVVRTTLDGNQCELVTTGSQTPQGSFSVPRYIDFNSAGVLYVSSSNRRVYAFTITG